MVGRGRYLSSLYWFVTTDQYDTTDNHRPPPTPNTNHGGYNAMTSDHGYDIGYISPLRDHYDYVGRSPRPTTTDTTTTEPPTTTTTEPRPVTTTTTTHSTELEDVITTATNHLPAAVPIPAAVVVRVYVAGTRTAEVIDVVTAVAGGCTTYDAMGRWYDDITAEVAAEPSRVLETVVPADMVPSLVRIVTTTARTATSETAVLVTATPVAAAVMVTLRP
jgi:hypothetical protein